MPAVTLKMLFVISATLLLAGVTPVTHITAQTRTPNPDPHQEYIYLLNQYYINQQSFNTNLSRYKTYQTAQSKEEALQSSISMLRSGQAVLLQYTMLVSTFLNSQPNIDSRVKGAITKDLQDHLDYLRLQTKNIDAIQTTDQSTEVSKGLAQRYTYIQTTSQQALAYALGVSIDNQIIEARKIVASFSQISSGFPGRKITVDI